jgi:hypothetical protein
LRYLVLNGAVHAHRVVEKTALRQLVLLAAVGPVAIYSDLDGIAELKLDFKREPEHREQDNGWRTTPSRGWA